MATMEAAAGAAGTPSVGDAASVGKSLSRVEGRLKVTGAARYTGDVALMRMTFASLVEATVAHGKIASLDTAAAARVPGVLAVISHRNAPKLVAPKKEAGGMGTEAHLALQSADVQYNGQIIAVIVAERPEQAREAAALVTAHYTEDAADLEMMDREVAAIFPPERFGTPLQGTRGDPDAAFADGGATTVDATYETPIEHHNPMEPHATVASWDGDELTVYETTQYLDGTRGTLAQVFGLPKEQVRVMSRVVGGGFGCKGSTWQHTVVAAMAARHVRRPVKLVLTRQNMFAGVGHRPRTVQRVAIAADGEGKITALRHDVQTHTSTLQDFIEPSSLLSRMLYAVPALRVSHRLARLNLPTSTFMRGPGETSGSFALESAMDELAVSLGMDPIQLRLRNHADTDGDSGLPFSSKHLRECYAAGAELFGWSQRDAAPKAMRDGGLLVGWGMATATYPGNRQGASARAWINADGTAGASSATHEIGQGTYTVMTQIAADALGLPPAVVRFELGSSLYPDAPVTGGSMTLASVGPAVQAAALSARARAIAMAVADPASPLHGADVGQVVVTNGRMFLAGDTSRGETYASLLARAGVAQLEAEATTPGGERGSNADHCRNPPPKVASATAAGGPDPCFSYHSFGAQFVEVKIDPATLETRVSRAVGVFDVGRVLNAKTSRSQALGGITMGLGMALMEETIQDPRTGRMVVRNLADYRVPVHADIPAIEVRFIDEPDTRFNPLGCRGVGEIPIVGVAAAVANAVFHATGIRVRKLPITPESLLNA